MQENQGIDISELHAGVYILKIDDENLQSFKVIKR